MNSSRNQNSSIFYQSIVVLLVLYFSIPKIDIVSLGQFGIRPLDFISLIIFFVLIQRECRHRFKVKTLLIVMMFFIVNSFISSFFNGPIGLVYVTRLFQYAIVGYAIAIVMLSHYKNRFLYIVITIQLLISALQMMQLLPNIDPGRSWYYASTFSGSFGTPAELSYFFVSLIGLYVYIKFPTRVIFAYILAFNSVLFAPLAFVALGFNRIISIFSQRVLFISSYLLLLLVMTHLLGFDLFIELIFRSVNEDIELAKGGVIPENFSITAGTESLIMRVNKILAMYDYMRSNYVIMFFGCGYGCGNGAIDSGLARLLLEFGILGFLLIVFLVKKIPIIPLATIISVNFLFDGLWSSVVAPIILSYLFVNLTIIRNSYVYSK
jgi:hypothetical protein